MMQWEGLAAVGQETTYGEKVTYSQKLALLSGTHETTRIAVEDERATSTRYQYTSVMTGIDNTYSLEMWAVPDMIGSILKWTLGKEGIKTQVEAGIWKHPIMVNKTLPSFTLYIDHGVGNSFCIAGCKVGTLTLESARREVVRLTVEGSGRSHSWESSLSLINSDIALFQKSPFVFQDLSFSSAFGSGSLQRDLEVERFALTINNNLITDKVTADGSIYIHEIPEGMLEVTGTFEKEFNSISEFNSFVQNQRLNLKAVYETTLTPSTNYTLEIILPECRITTLPLPAIAGTSERAIYTVDFRALYSTSISDAININLINTIENI